MMPPVLTSPAMVSPSEAGATLTVDLDAIVANWRHLAREAGSECAAVVKADAYGTGLTEVGPALARAGCHTFFVAHPGEGVALREACPGAIIYVLNGLRPGLCALYAQAGLRPVLGAREEIAEWQAFAQSHADAPPAALHVDTGMSRLGLSLADAGALASAGMVFPIALLMSHFVSAEIPGASVTARQIAAYAQARALFPGIPGSLANSSGIFVAGARHDLARPGYALYGGNPTPGHAGAPGRDNPMRGVIELVASLVQVREVGAGETVGYNGLWTARRPSRLAVISVGYADGYPRGAGGTDDKRDAGIRFAQAIVSGVRCPFAGRVSMDLIVLDVTDAPEARRGAPATLIGAELGIDEVGERAGTIGYEILTGLGRRYARVYRGV